MPQSQRTSSSSTNTQNVAFVSSDNTISINGEVNTTHGVTTTSTQATAVNSTTIDNLSDAVIFALFASQPNSPHFDNEDLQQIYSDDLEEMDLSQGGVVKTSTKGHFAMEYRLQRNQENRNRRTQERVVPVEQLILMLDLSFYTLRALHNGFTDQRSD
ncbi:hypothetical protein Tco_0360084 [Tanacetum coccineum]